MIRADQPTIFGNGVIAAISSRKNGNMKFGLEDEMQTLENRQKFLKEAGLDIAHTSLIGITYDTDDFAKYRIVLPSDKGAGMLKAETIEHADALVTDTPDHALFLPLADCVGAILYDEVHHVLMVSHLGRHSIEVSGAAKSVEFLKTHYATDPSQLKIWLSPGVGKATYPLRAFDGKGLHEVIISQLLEVGAKKENIEHGAIDTATTEQYYSHSEFLKGNQEQAGRFAIVAQMRERGEPAS
ncbi:MAG TPA: laccase domain-containing protein [Candidatus Saccharimonadales bacterium]|nr:laccase domain-containing protein [Candidatus Saccharimonadales bacterium]